MRYLEDGDFSGSFPTIKIDKRIFGELEEVAQYSATGYKSRRKYGGA